MPQNNYFQTKQMTDEALKRYAEVKNQPTTDAAQLLQVAVENFDSSTIPFFTVYAQSLLFIGVSERLVDNFEKMLRIVSQPSAL